MQSLRLFEYMNRKKCPNPPFLFNPPLFGNPPFLEQYAHPPLFRKFGRSNPPLRKGGVPTMGIFLF